MRSSATVAAAAPQLLYAESAAPKHDNPIHPECAARGRAIIEALSTAGLDAQALPGQVRRSVIRLVLAQPRAVQDVARLLDWRRSRAARAHASLVSSTALDSKAHVLL